LFDYCATILVPRLNYLPPYLGPYYVSE